MRKTFLLSALFLGLSSSGSMALAGVYYVKEGGNGDGTSWEKAAGDIDAMIEKATAGDEIWIAQGTYKPSKLIKSSKKNSRAFLLKDGVSLYGGFEGKESSKDERKTIAGKKSYDFVHTTILSGDDDIADEWVREMMYASSFRYGWKVTDKDIIPGTENNSNHILYANTEFHSPTTINGLTLKGGNAMVWNVKAAGGAIYALGNVQISDCQIIENSAYYTADSQSPDTKGGAVYLVGNGDASIKRCLFAKNYSHSKQGNGYGGAVYASKVKIEDCEFRDCVALDGGGAIYNIDGTIENCLFEDCYASNGGAVVNGGMMKNSKVVNCRGLLGGGISNISGTLSSVVVFNCYADTEDFGSENGGKGGGIYNKDGEILGSIVYNNSSFEGGGIYFESGTIQSSTLQNNLSRKEGSHPNIAFVNSLQGENNTEKTIYDAVDASNFVNPSQFIGFTDDSEKLSELKETSWALQENSPLKGNGFESATPTNIKSTEKSGKLIRTTYYTLSGKATEATASGVYIVKREYDNGSIETSKVLQK